MNILLILIRIIFLLFLYSSRSHLEEGPVFYVINVPGPMGEERRKYIDKIFSAAGIQYTFFPGYNKNEINMDRMDKKHDLQRGQVSLAMAHNDLYKKLLESDKPYMFICEDDCTVRPNFKGYVNQILSKLPEGFDAIKLERISDVDNYNLIDEPRVPYENDVDIKIKKYDTTSGSACYLVSRAGAEYFLELNEPIWLPSDAVFHNSHHIKKGMKRLGNIYYTDPQLAWQGNLKSILYN